MLQFSHGTTAESAPGTNGESTPHDLFALTDEQILELEPEAQDVEISKGQLPATEKEPPRVAPTSLPAGSASVPQGENRPDLNGGATQAPPTAGPAQPPQWLAERMKDPWTGEEASAFWKVAQQARQEAAAYRAAFATPEDARALAELYPGGVNEARTAADRARAFDEIDSAYFGGAGNSAEQTSAGRAELAQRMMRNDPAAFRDMVQAGLKVLQEATETQSHRGQEKAASASTAASPEIENRPPAKTRNVESGQPEAHLAAYRVFEAAANEDLERSVGLVIEKALEQALPNAGTTDSGALKGRLNATIRHEIEKALQGDQQLGEQVSRLLASRNFDGGTRAQVVRLIGERAAQLVPSAAKRVLGDWTHTAMAAHRTRAERTKNASAHLDLAPADGSGEIPRLQAGKNSQPSARNDGGAGKGAKVDYRKLSDEQILAM